MVKKKVLRIIATIFLIIGLLHGLISYSFINFATWLLIGLWLIFTLKIFENIKRHREFNSPHNTAFFVIVPLGIGIFYSIWGFYTGILGENLLGGVYFSLWSLIFAFPYVLLGSFSLYRCFKKYNVIYFGKKSVKARTLGYILSFSVLIFIIAYWITFYSFTLLDLNLLLLFIAIVLILIVFGFTSNTGSSIPTLTRDYIAERTRRINNLTTPSTQRQRVRTTRTTNTSPSTRTTTRTTRSRTQSSRTTPTSHRQTARTRTTNTTSVKPTLKVRDLNKYKPRASYLTVDDFKCIFCFNLPKLPGDRGRGIVVCPNCRYPAHADEFKDWMRTSNLCSRCSAVIPSGFRRNPRIISVKNYMIIYRHFLKKKR